MSGIGSVISGGKDAINNGIDNVKGVAGIIGSIVGKGKDVGKWVINGLTPG